MRSLFALSLILVFFVDQTYGTFAEFVSKIPTEIAKAFSTSWNSMKEALKRPGKFYRPGKGGKKKTTTQRTTTPEDSWETKSKVRPSMVNRLEPTRRARKLILPLLTPTHITIGDGRHNLREYDLKKNYFPAN